MKRMIQLGAVVLALSIGGAGIASAQTPEPVQQKAMEGAKTDIKAVHEQELHNHLMQNQAEQKQKEQRQMTSELEKVKAAQ